MNDNDSLVLTSPVTTYTFHTDPGHGWLEVPRRELERLQIVDRISAYSYIRGDTAFLEEDCDAYEFVQAKERAGERIKFNEVHTDASHWIRSLPRF